ncbi:phosphopantothenoylcysteine decarboxylase [Streptococcus azizii]|uniref:Phosphopantothenoylcysteine decarboxylase n=1 Tax=Streptococcus azizii TaxID=1579424 RepID=A0AB36JSR2_9STRE|nr:MULTISPECIES: phosphopantothenoylcysteine decarboxylase [Streptococcus]MBF0776141.1 phosphopantothenoylcysteine decarboxylase [Streptococcus sp. 19428wD3_AN2]ONK26914.1 phosphopantothenoylcysteine decarboxylase [Streptococcus azizii]ONK27936.1 phosphopantothenoylcysteine decarboxylase [Streptococcus azizii]ONK28780.1 phosphopantothenoylcysteine decarboxylase [Streptococcus azizii]TFU83486.1 phosphopantothenoylcysteine decarboxylase [Streptococcus sp. AN2]
MARITLAVTGSISAYKAADLTSQLGKLGHFVTILMTDAATQFITPLTLQALSKNLVHTDVMVEEKPNSIKHIDLAKQTDLFLVAPASAQTIAKLAHGFADNIVTAVALALPATTPRLIAPAMNTNMYQNPATQENLQRLQGYGFVEIPPRNALLTCGDVGTGALATVDVILEKVSKTLHETN